MLVSLADILHKAKQGIYAVPAFNINNFEAAKAVLEAAKQEASPVILATSEGALAYAGMDLLGNMVHTLIKTHPYPVVYHLDHGKKIEVVEAAIGSGYYTSVMFDGSSLSLQDNTETTTKLAALAHAKGISIEGELGAIAGIEDFVSVEEQDAHLTDPEEAATFAKETGIDALAIAIGTKHGAYKFSETPKLDLPRLKQIHRKVRIPLVLHGASGVPEDIKRLCTTFGCAIEDAKGVADDLLRSTIENGITKINIDTDLRIAFTAGIREELTKHPEGIDPRVILGAGSAVMETVARAKMRLFGSSGKAV